VLALQWRVWLLLLGKGLVLVLFSCCLQRYVSHALAITHVARLLNCSVLKLIKPFVLGLN